MHLNKSDILQYKKRIEKSVIVDCLLYNYVYKRYIFTLLTSIRQYIILFCICINVFFVWALNTTDSVYVYIAHHVKVVSMYMNDVICNPPDSHCIP